MITQLTTTQIEQVIKSTPEQTIFDWKKDINPAKRSEVLKDIVAIANATTSSPGFIFYGVNPNEGNPFCGISKHFDDSELQQLVKSKCEPGITFLYYEVTFGPSTIAVIHIEPSVNRPHIITKDFENLREGQILIRRGSSTEGIKFNDLMECFYGKTSPYLGAVLQHYGANAQQVNAHAQVMNQHMQLLNYLERQDPYAWMK